MQKIPRSLDDIAVTVRGYKINPTKKKFGGYRQRMQSLYGSRQFILETVQYTNNTVIKLHEVMGQEASTSFHKLIATRTAVTGNPFSIHKAIKSLERKAKCKLYYRLLISTDGEYL